MKPAAPARAEPACHVELVTDACRRLADADTVPDLDTLAAAAGLSRFQFHRLFKRVTGLTPKGYAQARRAERLRRELPRRGSVTEALYEAGYNASSRFYAEAAERLGMAPKRFRNGGAGEVIRFAVGQCSLGAVLVASSARGVCAILLGDDPEPLVCDLQARFPKAELIGGEAAYEHLVARVIGAIEAPRTGWDLPLDIRGTAFQQRVWQALRDIPPGCTLSYAALAERLGLPRAVRAVAGACAANALAVAIPCHRVVRRDGSLSGYRWGVERKRTLLEREGASGL